MPREVVVIPLDRLFNLQSKVIIGVVHLPPLPGSPFFDGDFNKIIERALKDAINLEEGGVDGIILENFGDMPFRKREQNPLNISAFTTIVREVVKEISVPVGINYLRNSAIEAASVAYISGAKFIRVNVYVETVATDSGIIEPAAPELLRFMSQNKISLGILADIHVKHGRVLGERRISDTIEDAISRGRASAVIITGRKTGAPPDIEDLKQAKEVGAKVIIGSGLSPSNIKLLELADGAIVGTFFKEKGIVSNPADRKRVSEFIHLVRKLW